MTDLAKTTPERVSTDRVETSWFRPFRGRSVRFRLLAIALLPMLVVMPLLLGVAGLRWSEKFDKLLISKVNGDLTIAHQYLTRILENSRDKVQALGASADFARIAASTTDAELKAYLEASRLELGFDFLQLVDTGDSVIAASPATSGKTTLAGWPVVHEAVAGRASSVIDVFDSEQLARRSSELAAQARLDLVPTVAAVPTDRKVESRGMVIHTAAPVTIGGQRAALVGGILLNRNLAFIDTINDLVYQQASLPEGSQGTATLFLEDVRVSTNVRLFENVRALGTRVSAEVRAAVLDEGRVWLDRAFVVNDWYISAYEPIVDSHGNRIGVLYVGFLERPFQSVKYTTLAVIGAAFLLVTAISVPILLRWARSIFKPLESVTSTIGRVEHGDLSARTGPVGSGDEIGKVAEHLDTLLEQLQERDRKLRDWATELNTRVEERTRELKDANQRLEDTTQQLVMSEKLAAIGEITAGVAHEINNPVAVIQGNLDVIRDSFGSEAEAVKTEFRLIDEQIHSINLIVTKLLQFARPEEYAGYMDRQAPDEVVTDCLLLVQHLMNKVEIEVRREQNSSGLVMMNRTELQQVIINLIVNAIHAMPKGGILTLRSYDHDQDGAAGLMIEVADTGKGMPADVLKKAFDPFFTTKRREGTGLGLSISQTLITRCGGHISARSVEGEGTTFSIWLPSSA